MHYGCGTMPLLVYTLRHLHARVYNWGTIPLLDVGGMIPMLDGIGVDHTSGSPYSNAPTSMVYLTPSDFLINYTNHHYNTNEEDCILRHGKCSISP